jgi:adenylyltransferase/sulfurtransferase
MEEPFDKSPSSNLSEKEIRRYALQIGMPSIGMEGQEKVKGAKVLVIGAGGKGSSVLQNLATVGVGKIGICDNYPVQENELARQYLYGNKDLGKQKAIISKQKLLEVNHLVDYELHNVCLNKNNINLICFPYDILIDATDNFPSRLLINDAAVSLGKPLIYGEVINSVGLVSVFNYSGGPSLRCLYPEQVKQPEKVKPDAFACQVSVMSIIGSIIANEALKIILSKETVLSGKLLQFDASTYSISLKKIEKNPSNFK